jgi:antitoxin component of MazEF toxin-antitoxin module
MVSMPVFESSRKVQLFGTSLAMTLPAMFVKANEIEKGSFMKVLYGLEGVLIASKVEDSKVLKGSLLKILDSLEMLTKREEDSKRDA